MIVFVHKFAHFGIKTTFWFKKWPKSSFYTKMAKFGHKNDHLKFQVCFDVILGDVREKSIA